MLQFGPSEKAKPNINAEKLLFYHKSLCCIDSLLDRGEGGVAHPLNIGGDLSCKFHLENC